jgi:hypothetical protein
MIQGGESLPQVYLLRPVADDTCITGMRRRKSVNKSYEVPVMGMEQRDAGR